MKLLNTWTGIIILGITLMATACSKDDDNPSDKVNENFDLVSTVASYNGELEQIEMTMEVKGLAGSTIPNPAGQLDGAPVLGYVFPTTLKSSDVGFGSTDGIVAMALTSHPDFDDTPLWDENNDRDYSNDGAIWHPHWVLLVDDARVDGGLSVKQFEAGDPDVVLPPTNPGMPMYMDSPGYQVVTEGNSITVVIPSAFVNHKTDFNYDAVAVRMQVNTSNSDLPMLGVYEVYEVLSTDLSLPYQVQ